ncbi:NAD(P)H oxidoreductase [Aneurinibacillus danicus]|jgi:putative NADPH-quinone reductase|uniref:NAD(P)H-dependent oxidoreductase n=1 Tax=Aneurinibacillus danicus TaxID=267746 RepID=A0A511VD61_9BACL|nr:NAD(P)H oxidoreductase [Aneurinibacillus danicus]GEN36826.1 NAD(P)H-dependent oxidoreductase [Aneurinibacillus danicus]
MKVLTIIAHPRKSSLTFAVANRFVEGLKDANHEVELLDLYREGFNPVLFEQDEPDWDDPNKEYSSLVHKEMERMKRNDALAFIFPVWWYSMPAIMKGYIDRVWNYGFAYGNSKLPHQKVLWIGLAGETEQQFQKRNFDKMLEQYLNVGLAQFTGIADSKVALLYDSLGEEGGEDHFEKLLIHAYNLGLHYTESKDNTSN